MLKTGDLLFGIQKKFFKSATLTAASQPQNGFKAMGELSPQREEVVLTSFLALLAWEGISTVKGQFRNLQPLRLICTWDSVLEAACLSQALNIRVINTIRPRTTHFSPHP